MTVARPATAGIYINKSMVNGKNSIQSIALIQNEVHTKHSSKPKSSILWFDLIRSNKPYGPDELVNASVKKYVANVISKTVIFVSNQSYL